MDPGTGSESSLTVNEQVIVMSGHETIRVLEVGVDAQLPVEEDGKGLENVAAENSHGRGPAEASEPAGEAGPGNPDPSAESAVKSIPGIPPGPAPAPAIATFSQAPSQPQASQTLTPLAVQAAPQVLTQENLATVLTGVMVPAGAVTQPLLIPISIAGQVAGQQGLAVWTIPTATVAALPGLTAASPTGGIFKPPLAGLQAAAVLNTALPAPVQATPPAQTSTPAQPRSDRGRRGRQVDPAGPGPGPSALEAQAWDAAPESSAPTLWRPGPIAPRRGLRRSLGFPAVRSNRGGLGDLTPVSSQMNLLGNDGGTRG